MLRLLLSHSSSTSCYQRLCQPSLAHSKHQLLSTAKSSLRSALFRPHCTPAAAVARQSAERCRSSLLAGLTLGGTGVLSAIAANYRHFWVSCRADRVSGYKSTAAQMRRTDGNFDWARFWTYLRPHLLKLLGAIGAALAVAYFNIQIPQLLGAFINTLSQFAGSDARAADASEFLRTMREPAARLFGIYVLQSAFTFAYILLLSQIGEQIAAKLRQDLFRQIVVQDIKFFDENRTGELVNRLTADVQDFKSCFKQCVSQGLRSAAQLIGGAVSLCLISPQMSAVALVSVPLAVGAMSMLGGALRQLSKMSQVQSERATMVCEEALSNIRTVRSNAAEFAEIRLFEVETDAAAEYSQRLGVGIAVFQALTNLCLNGMVLTTLFLGGHLMASNALTPGELMAFLVASQGVQRSLSQGSILLGTVIRGMTAGTRIFEYLHIEPDVDLVRGGRIPTAELRGEIRFRDVCFSYPTRRDQQVLHRFNLTLHAGQTVALVGASGSGKSTVAALLERFYEPDAGAITIDGRDVRELSPQWLRAEVIGFIEQQPILFGTSIRENIRYGRPAASDAEVVAVTKAAQSHGFIVALADGYETNVGERGTQLSGGQRQRIAIARAMLKRPAILILDEATSALDAASEADVQRALEQAVRDRTTLVIAHRLSTIKNADLIVVLDAGQIVEQGTHAELMSKRGNYFRLVQQQEQKGGGGPTAGSAAADDEAKAQPGSTRGSA